MTGGRSGAENAAFAGLENEYEIDEASVRTFRANGHLRVSAIAQVRALQHIRPSVQKVVSDASRRVASQGKIDDYSEYFAQVTNVWRLDESLRRFVFARRFASVAARLLGVSSVRLYHDQALFKTGGSRRTPWHRDSYYWPLDPRGALTMWLPLVDVTSEMGPLVFASGSHLDTSIESEPISEEGDRRLAHLIAEHRWKTATAPVALGDATFHAAATVHCSGPNRSANPREILTVIYYADGVPALEPANPHQQVDLNTFFPGVRPGEPAASELNPVLYS